MASLACYRVPMSTDYSAMPAPAQDVSGPSVLAYAIDSAGYRYHWATEGLPETALGFLPAPGSMSIGGLLEHMEQLAGWLQSTLTGTAALKTGSGLVPTRTGTFASLGACSAAVRAMSSTDLQSVRMARGSGDPLPMWNIIHGPIADFLTHVGQVTAWRRLSGCPAPVPRYALGLGPVEEAAVEPSSPPAHLRGLHIQTADLTESTFRDVALTGAVFDDVSLAGAKFNNVTFAGATIHNVDFSNVNLTDANIDGLRIDGEPISGS